MQHFTAEIEDDQETGLYVGFVAGSPDAHSRAESLDGFHENLREVVEMLLADRLLGKLRVLLRYQRKLNGREAAVHP